MSYATGEEYLLKRVRACRGFTTANTSQADWKVLNSGRSNCYAILKPMGGTSPVWIGNSTYTVTWTTAIEVWQRYKDDSTTAKALYTLVGYLLAILAYPNLGDATEAIIDSNIGEIGPVEEMMTESGGPGWLRWTIPVVWLEQTTVTFEE